MRRAARAVALENSRLRNLLAANGFPPEVVSRYLASFPDLKSSEVTSPQTPETPAFFPPAEPAAPLVADGGTSSLQEPRIADARCRRDMATFVPPYTPIAGDGRNLAPTPSDNTGQPSAIDKLVVLADASAQQTCCGSVTQCSGSRSQNDVEEPAPCPPQSDADSGPPPGPLETTCSTAANIMASLNRYGDEEMAREALGCRGTKECLVKNTVLFQLLDGVEER